MDFAHDARTAGLIDEVRAFVDEHVIPAEPRLAAEAGRDTGRLGHTADRARACRPARATTASGTSSSPAPTARD